MMPYTHMYVHRTSIQHTHTFMLFNFQYEERAEKRGAQERVRVQASERGILTIAKLEKNNNKIHYTTCVCICIV